MSPEPLSRFPIMSGFLAIPSTVESHLMHTSLHFQTPVSIPRAFRQIRPNLTLDCSKNIVCSLVGCRLGYANSTLVGISVKNISRLQRMQSTLARVVTCQRGGISISKTLQELYWLPFKWRIDYKVVILTYKLLESGEPTNMGSGITSRVFRSALRSSADDRQLEPCSSIRKLDHVPFVVPHRQ